MKMLCCALSGEKYKSKLTDQYTNYYDKYFPDFERHFKLLMQIKDIPKFTNQYKGHKAITGKTLAVNVFTIEAKKLSHLQITKDCNALLTEDVIDLGVITKRKGKGDDIGISNTDDWVGRDPKTEYHYVWIKNIRRLLFKNNLHKCLKFLCRNCFRVCSSSDFYNMHLKHCLDVNDGQKTIFPIKVRMIVYSSTNLGLNLLTPLSLHSILRVY